MKWDRDKLATWGMTLLIVYAAVGGVFRAASDPFWYDELCTVAIARQPGISAIRKALERAADSHPPVYYFIERFSASLLPNPHVAFRLPSIVGFCCVLWCVFIFVRKEGGAECALVCAALLLLSTLYGEYVVEARGYALMCAGVAMALVCYQRAPAWRWMLLMGFSLAAAGLCQYYAVFSLFPFALAEGVFLWRNRRLRVGVWFALACGMLPVIVFWPLLSQLKKYYGANFWAKPTLRDALSFFGWFFHQPFSSGLLIAIATFAGVAATMILRSPAPPREHEGGASRKVHPLPPEKVVVLGLLVLPLAVFVAMKITHGGLTVRYMLPAGLGIPLAAGFILPQFDRRLLAVLGLCMGFGFATHEASFWLATRHRLGKVKSPAPEVEMLVNKAGHRELPVVISDGLQYFQLAYYGTPALLTRIVDVVDTAQATAYSGTDSVDKQLLVLRSLYPLQVYEFHDFAATHSQFLLYSRGGRWDWWPTRLVDDGYVLRLLAIHADHKVYLVSLRGEAPEESPQTKGLGSDVDLTGKASP